MKSVIFYVNNVYGVSCRRACGIYRTFVYLILLFSVLKIKVYSLNSTQLMFQKSFSKIHLKKQILFI